MLYKRPVEQVELGSHLTDMVTGYAVNKQLICRQNYIGPQSSSMMTLRLYLMFNFALFSECQYFILTYTGENVTEVFNCK